jgi:hypothetical protein
MSKSLPSPERLRAGRQMSNQRQMTRYQTDDRSPFLNSKYEARNPKQIDQNGFRHSRTMKIK